MRTITPVAMRERERREKKKKQAMSDTFLNRLTALDCKRAKRELIEEHNPFFYTLFRG